MLTETNPELLTGTIEADEIFVGGLEKNKHKSKKVIRSEVSRTLDVKVQAKKTMVLGLVEKEGKVRTFVVPDREAQTLQGIMVANVAHDARLITDALTSYIELRDVYDHISVKHTQGDYVTHGDKHTNNIEGYWSILKRGVIGTFHFVSPQHLQRYCDEFAHRYNTRKQSLDTRFAESIKQFGGARLKYRELTPNQPEPHRKLRYIK